MANHGSKRTTNTTQAAPSLPRQLVLDALSKAGITFDGNNKTDVKWLLILAGLAYPPGDGRLAEGLRVRRLR